MSNVAPTYRFRFFRSPEVSIDSWVEHETFGRINYRLGSENGMGMLAHLIQSTGQPDGDIVATEVNRKVPLVQYLESLYRLAEHRAPFPVPPSAVSRALRVLAKNPQSWLTISCKPDLLGRDLVTLEGGQAILTFAGATMLTGLDSGGQSVTLSVNQREAFEILRTAPRKWLDLNGRTKNFMIVCGWVEIKEGMPTLTHLGQQISDRANASPIVKDGITEVQCQAFETASRRPYKWMDDVPERTAKAMIASGWIIVRDDLPRLTDEGRRVYDSHLVETTRKAA
jgi:hypothetical protein